jgi:hypothetical protein
MAVSHIEFTRAQFRHRIVLGQLWCSLPVLVAFTTAKIQCINRISWSITTKVTCTLPDDKSSSLQMKIFFYSVLYKNIYLRSNNYEFIIKALKVSFSIIMFCLFASTTFPVDVVYTWVNGSDTDHRDTLARLRAELSRLNLLTAARFVYVFV